MRNKAAAKTGPVTDLRSRNLRSVQLLAEDMLGRPTGGRLPTTIDYQQQLGVGSGTVQKALAILENSGAVTLSRHGHLGTNLVERDEGLLWSMSGRNQVHLVMPMPGPIDHIALLHNVREQLTRFNVPTGTHFKKGAATRAELVADGDVDLALMSRSAAKSLRPGLRRRTRTVDLGPNVYYTPGSLVVVSRLDGPKRPRKLKVAIDRSSHDHQALTEAEFPPGPKHTYVDCSYVGVLNAIHNGSVDVAIWHTTLVTIPLEGMGLTVRPLTADKVDELVEGLSAAVFLLRKDDAALGSLLENLNVEEIAQTQEKLNELDRADPTIIEYLGF
ncbi:MAG: hypothetical protein GEV07_08460 [Streptosporangiales bacterium]|nr:hypothetical protein [Streptosporangiales bacterium]